MCIFSFLKCTHPLYTYNLQFTFHMPPDKFCWHSKQLAAILHQLYSPYAIHLSNIICKRLSIRSTRLTALIASPFFLRWEHLSRKQTCFRYDKRKMFLKALITAWLLHNNVEKDKMEKRQWALFDINDMTR